MFPLRSGKGEPGMVAIKQGQPGTDPRVRSGDRVRDQAVFRGARLRATRDPCRGHGTRLTERSGGAQNLRNGREGSRRAGGGGVVLVYPFRVGCGAESNSSVLLGQDEFSPGRFRVGRILLE
jgi:hypothetical protein